MMIVNESQEINIPSYSLSGSSVFSLLMNASSLWAKTKVRHFQNHNATRKQLFVCWLTLWTFPSFICRNRFAQASGDSAPWNAHLLFALLAPRDHVDPRGADGLAARVLGDADVLPGVRQHRALDLQNIPRVSKRADVACRSRMHVFNSWWLASGSGRLKPSSLSVTVAWTAISERRIQRGWFWLKWRGERTRRILPAWGGCFPQPGCGVCWCTRVPELLSSIWLKKRHRTIAVTIRLQTVLASCLWKWGFCCLSLVRSAVCFSRQTTFDWKGLQSVCSYLQVWGPRRPWLWEWAHLPPSPWSPPEASWGRRARPHRAVSAWSSKRKMVWVEGQAETDPRNRRS